MPERFLPAIERVQALAAFERYLGAFVFGSVAQGSDGEGSDLDVKVLVAEDNGCRKINHPRIAGVKLDLTFLSLDQLVKQTREELSQARRPPMLTGALVVFDKTGELGRLCRVAAQAKAPRYDPEEAQFDRFMLYHADDKAKRRFNEDMATGVYSMHATIHDVVAIHYRTHDRYPVSSKRTLADRDGWDPELARRLRAFVLAASPQEKLTHWTSVVAHVYEPLGGRRPLEEDSCSCTTCVADLAALAGSALP